MDFHELCSLPNCVRLPTAIRRFCHVILHRHCDLPLRIPLSVSIFSLQTIAKRRSAVCDTYHAPFSMRVGMQISSKAAERVKPMTGANRSFWN